MKLNNKGFAITAVLYGLLILFVLLVGSYLVVLSAKKNRVDNLVNDIEDEYNAVNLVEYIKKLYDEADKISVTNNGINYNYAESVSLMNDRLSGTTSLNEGNIRYYSANPSNYIYFNCSDYSNQSDSNCDRWRIIGVFEDNVKIVKEEKLGSYAWDYTSSGSYENSWSDSTLNSLLNDVYYNSSSTTYYNGSTTGTMIDFSSNGIKDTSRNLISDATWYIGDSESAGMYSNDMYQKEINTTWNGKISLLSSSDYGYSVDFSEVSCDTTLNNYSAGCSNSSWFIAPLWLLNKRADSTDIAFLVSPNGDVNILNKVYAKFSVYPVLYLNKDIMIYKGNGTSGNPYQIFI